MMHEKYTKKMMEIKKIGEYVERLASIEGDIALDVDEGKLDNHILSLVENCIDAINQEYILASARQDINEIKALNNTITTQENTITTLGDKLDELQYINIIQNEQLNENGIKVDTRTINPRRYLNDCDEFGKISDIVTQDDECNEKESI